MLLANGLANDSQDYQTNYLIGSENIDMTFILIYLLAMAVSFVIVGKLILFIDPRLQSDEWFALTVGATICWFVTIPMLLVVTGWGWMMRYLDQTGSGNKIFNWFKGQK